MNVLVALRRTFLLSGMLAAGHVAFPWNVFMAGDSHVCSRIYPEGVEKIICREEPDIHFSYYGKIGAGFYTYNDSPALMEEVYDTHPDILIVHLGTNDSFIANFKKNAFLNNVGIFYDNVTSRLPECKIVFVTPFYNKLHGSKIPNKSTRKCSDALLEFSASHGNTYVIDNNASHGMYFLNHHAEMMRRDNVHLTVEGYEELARQVGDALVELEDLWIIEEPPYLGGRE